MVPYLTSNFAFLNTGSVVARGFVELPIWGLVSGSHVISLSFPMLRPRWKVSVMTVPSSSTMPEMLQTMRHDVHMSMSYWLHGSYSLTIDLDPRESCLGASRFL